MSKIIKVNGQIPLVGGNAIQSTGGGIEDVTVNGESVVTDGVAEIDLSAYALKTDLPQNVSDLTNDSGYLTLSTLPIYNGGVE